MWFDRSSASLKEIIMKGLRRLKPLGISALHLMTQRAWWSFWRCNFLFLKFTLFSDFERRAALPSYPIWNTLNSISGISELSFCSRTIESSSFRIFSTSRIICFVLLFMCSSLLCNASDKRNVQRKRNLFSSIW